MFALRSGGVQQFAVYGESGCVGVGVGFGDVDTGEVCIEGPQNVVG